MGVARRVTECDGDALLEVLADVVLQDLGLIVDAVPGHSERLGEERLEQPVMADHLEGHPLTRRRQLGALIRLVAHQPERRHPFQHRGDRAR